MYLTNLALHMIYNIILIEISLMYIHKNIDDQLFIYILGLKNKNTQQISSYVRVSK